MAMSSSPDESLVSVILPTCGRPQFLPQAAASVLSQTYRRLELLIIDDRPSADSTALCQRLAAEDTRVRYLAAGGLGAAGARNLGIAYARGRLIAFLDDDDLWYPRKLETQVALMRAHPWLGLVCSRFDQIDDQGRAAHRGWWRRLRSCLRPRPRLAGFAASKLLYCNWLTTSTIMVRQECLAQCGGFDPALAVAQDWDLWLRIAERYPILELRERLAAYRRHRQHNSQRFTELRRCEVRLLEKAWERWRGQRGWARLVLRRRLSWAHYRLSRQLAREGDEPAARRHLARAIALLPLHLRPLLSLTGAALPLPTQGAEG